MDYSTLTDLEKDRLYRLPLDPNMFNQDDWNDLERRLIRVLKEDGISSSCQKSLMSDSAKNDENVQEY